MNDTIEVPLPAPGDEDRNLAMLAHLFGLFGFLAAGFGQIVCPLVLYVVKRDDAPFVAFHALQTSLFHLVMTLGVFVITVVAFMTCVLIPVWPVAVALVVLAWVLISIMGVISARKGEWSRYPFVGAFALRCVLDRHAKGVA